MGVYDEEKLELIKDFLSSLSLHFENCLKGSLFVILPIYSDTVKSHKLIGF